METQRIDPPAAASELDMLLAWLEYHRATLAWKCEDLSPDDLRRRSVPPSTMSLLGLVRHMAEVERGWFQRGVAAEDAPPLYYSDADPDGDFDNVDTADVDEAFRTWNAQCRAADAIIAAHSLDDIDSREDRGGLTLRWILIHMIEEYARHNGHADLIRECLDGATGD